MAEPKPVPDWVSNAALVVPLLLVNSVAVYGQVQWAHEHLTPGSSWWVVAVGFALAVESIGVYLAAEAHRALLAGDASLRLRLGSYGVGALAGALNYAHFAPALKDPNTQSIVFGVLSAISPVLWAIRSRSISRDQLRTLNLIDGRAVKFTAAQWILFPRESWKAFRAAVWAGETNPAKARALASQAVPVRLARLTVVYLAGTFNPEPQALPGDLGRVLPAVAATVPRRKEVVGRPKAAAITDGRQRMRPEQHPLWHDWLEAYRSESPWDDYTFAEKLGNGVTMAAARSRRQRWERAAAELSMSS
jgi:hypothetical protein